MTNTCPVCGGKLGLLNREKSADGLICAGATSFTQNWDSELQSSRQMHLRHTG